MVKWSNSIEQILVAASDPAPDSSKSGNQYIQPPCFNLLNGSRGQVGQLRQPLLGQLGRQSLFAHVLSDGFEPGVSVAGLGGAGGHAPLGRISTLTNTTQRVVFVALSGMPRCGNACPNLNPT